MLVTCERYNQNKNSLFNQLKQVDAFTEGITEP